MASNFTLCPGGDNPWSMRAYEAALAGSICVISSYAADWRPATNNWDPSNLLSEHHGMYLQKIFDRYKAVLAGDDHVYNKTAADENLEVFLRYQTFMYGD